jgi:protein-S-isoprenylcysteine O-methyltransferase Ste14
MYRFLVPFVPFVPLLAGFVLAGASAFTAAFSRKWGEHGGQIATSVLRNLLGIPFYFLGLVRAWQASLPVLFDSTLATRSLAWGLIVAGSIPVTIGHLQLGWRTHMPSLRDALVTQGLYARVRHPIYAGAVPVFMGLALLRPTAPFVAACGLSITFFVVQALLEEIDLIERIPAYRQYMREVPAFIPRLEIERTEQPWLADWYWLCPLIAIGLAAGLFAWWGFDGWTALLAALFLVCPALMVWGVFYLGRKS